MEILVLASQSPRRRELLAHLGLPFSCVSPDVDESLIPGESPARYVARLAVAKAQAGLLQEGNSCWALGSDTAVIVEGEILGKPTDFDDCRRMLTLLSNRSHQVLTGIALCADNRVLTKVVNTQVTFAQLTEQEIKDYWATGEPRDKAGSYGIQGIGGKFVKAIDGSFSAVVGLPLFETGQLLKQAKLIDIK